jgi:glycosyltransferase involved in cell wall biosynthesis
MNAVLSLHRSEGLGLLVAEAMILEKPVIATDYSATREFLSEATGYPVGYELVPVGEGDYAFSEGQIWADADVAQAAWLMRCLHEDTGRAAPKLARARAHLQQNYSRAFVAELQAQRLRALAPSLRAES